MSSTDQSPKTFAVAIVCGGHPHVFIEDAPYEVAASISAFRRLQAHLSESDSRYDFYGQCEPFCDWLEAQKFETLEALNQAIQDAADDMPETVCLGYYTEEVVSVFRHNEDVSHFQIRGDGYKIAVDESQDLARKAAESLDHWQRRAFQMLRAAKGYRDSYEHVGSRFEMWRDEAHKSDEHYEWRIGQLEAKIERNKRRVLPIIAAGMVLGEIIHLLIELLQ